MSKSDVLILFSSHIVNTPEFGDVLNIGDGQIISVDSFADLFSAAPSTPTYAELIAIDGGVMGYIPFFDRCKAGGILN